MVLVEEPRHETRGANPTAQDDPAKAHEAMPRPEGHGTPEGTPSAGPSSPVVEAFNGQSEPSAAKAEDGTPLEKKDPSSVKVEFRRDMRLLDITMIGIGAMIGAGIFVLSGIAADYAGPACIIAFILNGIINTITGMTYAELGSAYPEAGGGYLWVRKGLPPPAGFVSGWISWFGHTVACSLYALGFGTYMNWLLTEYHINPFPVNDFISPDKIIAVIVAVLLLYINYRGTAATGKSEIFLTGSKLLLLFIFIGLGAFAMFHNPKAADNLFGDFFPNDGTGILYAMSLTLIAFQGYEVIAQTGEEVKDPKKNIPRAIFIALLVVTLIYIAIAVILFGIVTGDIMTKAGATSPSEYLGTAGSSGELALVEIAKAAIGPWGIMVILLGGFLSTLSALNATIFSSSRVSFAMGRDGTLPRALGHLHSKRRTPHNAIAVSGSILIIMVVLFPIKTIAGAADVMFLVLFAITNTAGIALRYKMPHLDRGFKVPLFPALPILGVILNLALIYPLYLIEPLAVYLGIIWIMVGAYIYFFTGAKKDILETPIEIKEMAPTIAKEKAERYRVLVPLGDLEEESMVDLGAVIAKSRGGDLSLLNIVEVPQNTPTTAVGYMEVRDQIEKMERLEQHAKRSEVDVDARLLISHEVADTIIDAAKTEHANLLLIGWYGHRRRGFIMGTNIDKIVASADADVVVLKWKGLMSEIKDVTLLFGEGHHVDRAAELAATVAHHHGAKAIILYVTDGSGPITKEKERMRWLRKVFEDRKVTVDIIILYVTEGSGPTTKEKERLRWLRKVFEDRKVTVDIKMITNASLIQGVVNWTGITDILFIGAEETQALGHNLFGNRSDRIAMSVTCPVAIVKSVGKEEGQNLHGEPAPRDVKGPDMKQGKDMGK
jgi:amino acid transporter/nucleotide-binding universal stress UspA family protein